MDYLSNLAKGGDQPKPKTEQPSNPDNNNNQGYTLSGGAKAVAGATADVLGAASDYGKLDDTKGVGKYVDQAETYLRDYNTSDSPAAVPAHKPAADEKPAAGGGAGDYAKMAKSFLNKHSGEGEIAEKSEGEAKVVS